MFTNELIIKGIAGFSALATATTLGIVYREDISGLFPFEKKVDGGDKNIDDFSLLGFPYDFRGVFLRKKH